MCKTYHCKISRYKINGNILNPVRGGGSWKLQITCEKIGNWNGTRFLNTGTWGQWINSFRIPREIICNLEFYTNYQLEDSKKTVWGHERSQNLSFCIILQETTRWYILPKCGHKPRKKWDSRNGESNIGKKQKKILGRQQREISRWW